MADNHISLYCLVDGLAPSNAFPVDIESTKTIGNLKDLIKAKQSPDFDDVAANKLTLWRVSVPDDNPGSVITIAALDSKTELSTPRTPLSQLFPKSSDVNTYIIVQRPPPARSPPASNYISQKRLADDGEKSPGFRNDLQAGDVITMPSLGQIPKEFGQHGQGCKLFVTEQMLELWKDMRGDKEHAKVLDTDKEEIADTAVVERFLALNKDILTGAELEKLVDDYDGSSEISRDAVWVIFDKLLKSRDRKTLLLVDEHRKLFKNEPYVPEKFKSLTHLSSYGMWGEVAKGSRVIFTGTAHAKYEMTILEESYRFTSVVYVGPLSTNVFSKLLDTYPCLSTLAIKEKVMDITNHVPRELVYLSAFSSDLPDPISAGDLQNWTQGRTKYFLSIADMYIKSRDRYDKERFYRVLLHTFLGSSSAVDFEWDFLDLGLIYRSKDVGKVGTQHHILCRPAQNALLELFKNLPLSEDTKERIFDGNVSGDDFEKELWRRIISTPKPIELHATDLNNKNPTTVSLNFIRHDTINSGSISLGFGNGNVMTRGYRGHPRFGFMLGPMLIQVSVRDFGAHNEGSADIKKAFDDRDKNDGTNQIERYLNDVYGAGHSARMINSKFVVTKDGVLVPGFRIVYIRGSPGKPTHRELVKKFPDVLHIAFDQVIAKLFENLWGTG
ncbi:hypothetical protein EDD11_007888 [Mortierella claussenii]|nr:hypothetical protein EDD11_007888 [Mortierella claussenii]